MTDKDVYEEWRKAEYGLSGYEPAEKRNRMAMEEAVHSIRLNRNRDEAMACLLECGLPENECRKLMDDEEMKYRFPRLQEDGTYVCPNCKTTVTKGQERCPEETCRTELVWRK